MKKGRELERKGLSNWKAAAKVISLGVGATLVLGVGVQAQAVTVSTVAGSYHERGHLDGTGREARFEFPQGIVAAPDGSIYIADTGNDMIRKISSNGLKESMPTPAHLKHLTYEVETIAGANHRARFRDGVGTNSRFNNPEGLAISPDGKTLYVADSRNNRIRKIDLATKTVSTLAGRAFPGGNDGVGTGAGLNAPRGLVISPDGNTLYIADSGNNAIRKMDLGSGQVTTIAGGGAFMPGYADGVGTQATFKEPRGLAISSDGQVLYIADTRNNLIRKMVIATGNVSTIAGHAGFPGTLNGPGPDAYFYQPVSLALDGNKLYVADGANADIRMVDLGTGTVSTVAGATLNGGVPIAGREDGDGVEGHFQFPGALTTFHGLIFVTDSPADTIREVSF